MRRRASAGGECGTFGRTLDFINGFPGDHEVAKLVAADLTNQHPHCRSVNRSSIC